MSRFAELGNDLYTGRRSVDFVGQRNKWYLITAVIMLIAILGFLVRGLNLGLEFEGGSEFRVATTGAPSDFQTTATSAVRETAGNDASANVSVLGGRTVRVQTEELSADQSRQVSENLAQAFDVQTTEVSSNYIGPSWGASVSQQALRALVVFLVLTTALMALYYRNFKMALASMVALAHDMIITVGIYTWSGFEVSPATMIGFLTVLGYSLYDTVVVFDKVRENTQDAFANKRSSYADAANLAVNQTLVRSINTTVIAVLPILAVLVIGFAVLGPGTLLDLSLSLAIGMTVGAFSSVFIATPLLVQLRAKDDDVVALDKHIEKHGSQHPIAETGSGARGPVQQAAIRTSGVDEDSGGARRTGSSAVGTATAERPPRPALDDDAGQTVTGRKVHKYAQSSGPRNQPKRPPKSKR